jgi:hypothetical protein
VDEEIPNRIFVTRGTRTITQLNATRPGGQAAANAFCTAEAMDNGIRGTFVALLAHSRSSLASQLEGARGFMRVDRVAVADQPSELIAGDLLHPIAVDAAGDLVTEAADVLTGADRTGATDRNCENYTETASRFGVSAGTAAAASPSVWLDDRFTRNCSLPFRFICAETTRSVRVVVPEAPRASRFAFVTAMPHTPGGPVSPDDACNAEATASGLPGEFRAVLPGSTPPSMLWDGVRGSAVVRPVFVVLSDSLADFFAGTWLTTPNRHADRTTGDAWYWGDRAGFDYPQTPDLTCMEWTSSSAAAPSTWSAFVGTTGNGPCTTSNRVLLCLQR